MHFREYLLCFKTNQTSLKKYKKIIASLYTKRRITFKKL